MESDVIHTPAELAPGRVEETPHVATQPGWQRLVLRVVDYELVFILLPVGAAILVNQLPWQWVVGSWVMIPFTWLARWVVRGRLTVRTPLDIPILSLILMLPAGLYASADLELSRRMVLKFVIQVALFYSIVNTVRSQERLRYVGLALLATSIGIAAISLLGTNWVTSKVFALPAVYQRLPKLVIRPLNPAGYSRNIVGGALAMLLPVTAAYLWFGRQQAHRALAGIAVLLVGTTLLLSQSRGAWIGAGFALLLLAIWRSRWFLLTLPAAAGGIVFAFHQLGQQAFADFALIDGTITSAEGRLEVWSRAIYMLQDFPYTGIGIGTFQRVGPVLYPYFLIGPDAEVPHAHNIYLQAGVDFGVPGLVAYLGLWTALLLVTWEAARRLSGAELYPLAVGLFCGFAAYLVHGLTDAITGVSIKAGIVLWILIGVAIAVWTTLHATQSQ